MFFPLPVSQPNKPALTPHSPYFPGYRFVKVDLECDGFATLQYIHYSNGLLRFGGDLAIVPEELIQSLRRKMAQLNSEEWKPLEVRFKPGKSVVIEDGVLNGYECLFDESLTCTERSRILIQVLGQQTIRVEILNSC